MKMLLAVAFAAVLSITTLLPPAGGSAQPCPAGCSQQTKACALSAHVSLRSCLANCRGSANTANCRPGCVTTFKAAMGACATDRDGCRQLCPPPTPPGSCPGAFLDRCGQALAACARDVITRARACVRTCGGSATRGSCLQACAAAVGAGGEGCRTAFVACTGPCGPPTTTTTLPRTSCDSDADCTDDNFCTGDRCANGQCEHVCLCLDPSATQNCCPGPAALCMHPTTTTTLPTGGCGPTPFGTCGGQCPTSSTCTRGPVNGSFCQCVSGPGGPCGGNIQNPPPVCAPGLVCQQTNPDVTGVCVSSACIPFFTGGCAETTDCCEPCVGGRIAPCAVCVQGTCLGAP
jgi:hypothetical protein